MTRRKKTLSFRISRAFWIASDWFLGSLEMILTPVCHLLGERYTLQPPVFILGAPRSGTTLIYQILIQAFRFAYVTNGMANLPHAPWLATRLLGNAHDSRRQGSFTSEYGRTRGLDGPAEAGDFWYRWFRRGRYVYTGRHELLTSQIRSLRNAVSAMTAVTGRPIVFKNTYHAMRIPALVEAFPEACFLVVHRDPIDIAQSILVARQNNLGCKDTWWGLPPKEIDDLEIRPYWEQVAGQAILTYRQIEADRCEAPDRFFDVDYAAFCASPQAFLDRLSCFLADRGIDVQATGRRFEPFPVITGKKKQVELQDYERIRESVETLWT
jgi:hypothetical protein